MSIRPLLRLIAGLLAATLLTAAAPDAMAVVEKETIQTDTSDREIAIESDFTGARITVFGAVDNSKQEAANSGYYDIVMIIRGPGETVVARQKERIVGIWVNGRAANFDHVPSYYAALSTRPLDEIADDATLRRYGIEFNPKPHVGEQALPPPNEFEQAVIDAKKREKLYVIAPFAVAFLGTSLFRGTVALPAKVRVGNYSAEVYLFHQGKLLSQHNTTLRIHKAGIERQLTALAYNQPWVYGVLSVLVAVTCGLLGWTLFARN
jgi:uncharacterized protein (TIGR02186 family)